MKPCKFYHNFLFFVKYELIFNNFSNHCVCKIASEKESIAAADDMLFRYNVNGIELNADGFAKLSKKIHLKSMESYIPDLQKDKIKIYTGKFPTVTGEYQRLVIREARIPEVVPDELRVIRKTDQKYYDTIKCVPTRCFINM